MSQRVSISVALMQTSRPEAELREYMYAGVGSTPEEATANVIARLAANPPEDPEDAEGWLDVPMVTVDLVGTLDAVLAAISAFVSPFATGDDEDVARAQAEVQAIAARAG